MYQTSSESSSPIQSMSENSNLVNSFIITNGLVSRLSDINGSKNALSLLNNLDKNNKQSPKFSSDETSITQKKPLRRLNNSNCEIQNDLTIMKSIPNLYERFIEVCDSVTKKSCQVFMCKACRCLLKKNTDILLGHLCKQKDIEKFSPFPVVNNQLVFRSKPKNRATPIWDEFEEVVEPSSNLLLGYSRCKRCLEIIKTSDPKSIPSVLRRHVPQCTCGPFPSNLLVTPNSKSASENTTNNNQNNQKNSNHNSVKSTNSNNLGTSANNLSAFIKELSSVAMKNLTNQNNFNLTNLANNLNTLNNCGPVNALNPITILPTTTNLNQNANSINPSNNDKAKIIINSSKINNRLQNEFRLRCIEFCCKELISLDTLNSPSFVRLCQTLMRYGSFNDFRRDPEPQVPDLSQLNSQLYTQYSTLRFRLKNDLQLELCKNAGGALVCDSQDDLCVLATYYVSNDWKLKEIVLSCDSYGNEINYFITNTLNDYHLNEEDKLSKFTFLSRGGQFDGVGVNLTSIAHTIDQIINNTIFYDDTYTDLIDKCRLICNELQIEIKLEPIVENVDWITKYEAMKHVLINVDKYELNSFQMNIDLIKFLVHLLTPFRNASSELRNCSKYPTLNHVLLWYYKIMKSLEENDNHNELNEMEEKDDDEDLLFIKETKRSIREKVEEQFELHSLHKIAVFLWPNFRSLKMLNKDERAKVHEEVRDLLQVRLSKEDLEQERESLSLETKSKKARTDFADWEEDEAPLNDQDEVYRYLNETLSTCDERNLLNWWKSNQSKFPKLSQLAKWVLSIPASVNLIEKFKLQNSPKIDEEILFLHCNFFDKVCKNES